jgi:hypothetical protein
MKKLLFIGVFVVIGFTSTALGQGYAWTAPTSGLTTNSAAGTPIVLGDVFKDLAPANQAPVTYLGIYAGNNASYAGPETVSLWGSTGTLLTSIVVFKGDSPANGYYWDKVTAPVQLTNGATYTVAVQVNQNGWGYGPIATNNWSLFLNAFNNPTSGTVFPTATTGQAGTGMEYYGANVWLGNFPAVPEGGASWPYLLVAGTACLGAFFVTFRSRLSARG